jgi:hypothetical protein
MMHWCSLPARQVNSGLSGEPSPACSSIKGFRFEQWCGADDRAASLRAAGAEVVVGDLLEPADVDRAVSGCSRIYFGMSVSAG